MLIFFFLSWISGTLFMFHFAQFMSMLRNMLRPGVLWFIKDMNDESTDPFQDLLVRPIYITMHKIFTSFLIYLILIVFFFSPLAVMVHFNIVQLSVQKEWNIFYWLLYFMAIGALDKLDTGKYYKQYIRYFLRQCADICGVRSVLFGGLWVDDLRSITLDTIYDTGYGDDGIECVKEEDSFMLVLAQDEFVTYEPIKQIFGVDQVATMKQIHFELQLALPTDPIDDADGNEQPAPERWKSLEVTRYRPQRSLPLFNSFISWRDPFRIRLGLLEYKELIGRLYVEDNDEDNLYREGWGMTTSKPSEKPSPITVDILIKPLDHEAGPTPLKLKGTIVRKPRNLFRSVISFLALFISVISFGHYSLIFTCIKLGMLLTLYASQLTGIEISCSYFGYGLIGFTALMIAVLATIAPASTLYQYLSNQYAARLKVCKQAKQLGTLVKRNKITFEEAKLKFGDTIGLDLEVNNVPYHLMEGHRILNLYAKGDRKHFAKHTGPVWFLPLYSDQVLSFMQESHEIGNAFQYLLNGIAVVVLMMIVNPLLNYFIWTNIGNVGLIYQLLAYPDDPVEFQLASESTPLLLLIVPAQIMQLSSLSTIIMFLEGSEYKDLLPLPFEYYKTMHELYRFANPCKMSMRKILNMTAHVFALYIGSVALPRFASLVTSEFLLPFVEYLANETLPPSGNEIASYLAGALINQLVVLAYILCVLIILMYDGFVLLLNRIKSQEAVVSREVEDIDEETRERIRKERADASSSTVARIVQRD